jgi:hypothetical protein
MRNVGPGGRHGRRKRRARTRAPLRGCPVTFTLAPMSSTVAYVRRVLSGSARRRQLVKLADDQVVAFRYERTPEWWARPWIVYSTVAVAFTGTYVFWSLLPTSYLTSPRASAMQLTWQHWTRRVSPADAKGSRADASTKETPPAQAQWELRPEWQRVGLCLGQFGLGMFFASLVLTLRTRIVRTLLVLPPLPPSPGVKSTPRRIFIQCANHSKEVGHVFPMSSTEIPHTQRTLDLLLHVEGIRGGLSLGLDGVRINGEEKPKDKVREQLQELWWGKAAWAGTSFRPPPRFTGGPMAKSTRRS